MPSQPPSHAQQEHTPPESREAPALQGPHPQRRWQVPEILLTVCFLDFHLVPGLPCLEDEADRRLLPEAALPASAAPWPRLQAETKRCVARPPAGCEWHVGIGTALGTRAQGRQEECSQLWETPRVQDTALHPALCSSPPAPALHLAASPSTPMRVAAPVAT